jgi:hypothetical protein
MGILNTSTTTMIPAAAIVMPDGRVLSTAGGVVRWYRDA